MPWATGALALACLALALLPDAGPVAFDRQAILAGEFLRLWSGHLVHFTPQHLYMDVAVLLVAGMVAEGELGTRHVGAMLLLGMPLLALGLVVLVPELAHYRGVSGVVMLLAVAAGTALWRSRPEARPVLAVMALGLVLKTLLDATGALPGLSSLPGDVSVAWQAHVLGAGIGGLAVSMLPSADFRSARVRGA